MAFVRAAGKDEVKTGTICEIQVGGKAIALANVSGKFCAISSICAHQGGPLGEGELEGQVVTCPWHGWQFDVTTGKVAQSTNMGVDTYQVEVRGDDIYVDVDVD
jgi:nitrite reductase/ring-hydroxylating ferredoxin subunit